MVATLYEYYQFTLGVLQSAWKRKLVWLPVSTLAVLAAFTLANCGGLRSETGGATTNTQLSLVDWHISGLWVINSPVAWLKVTNYNSVPIHDIELEYQTFDNTGKPLDKGTFTLEGTVAPHTTKNFIEQYLGLVDLYTEQLKVRLVSVKEASTGTSGH